MPRKLIYPFVALVALALLAFNVFLQGRLVSLQREVELAAVGSATSASEHLSVSTNGRYFTKGDGSPFFWLGDTAWWLMDLSDEDIVYYMADRVSKGFTGIQIMMVMVKTDTTRSPTDDPADYYGHLPFSGGGTQIPNVAYWNRVERIIKLAEVYGLYVGLFPMWGGDYDIYFKRDTSKIGAFGRWLGGRFKDRPNIWWGVSGEYDAINGYRPDELTKTDFAVFDAMAGGLEEGHGGRQLMSMHPGILRSSVPHFYEGTNRRSWMDFNMLQSGHQFLSTGSGRNGETHTLITEGYNESPAKPIFDAEPMYEDIPDGVFLNGNRRPRATAKEIRRKWYWSVFAGGCGLTYGHSAIYLFRPFHSEGQKVPYPRGHWKDALHAEGAGQVRHLRTLMESRPFHSGIPDQSVIVSPPPSVNDSSGIHHMRATRASDGRYAMVYIPTGRPVTVDMGKLSGSGVTACWFNPREGSSTPIGRYDNRGEREFAPGTSGDGNDWVLVLDSIPAT